MKINKILVTASIAGLILPHIAFSQTNEASGSATTNANVEATASSNATITVPMPTETSSSPQTNSDSATEVVTNQPAVVSEIRFQDIPLTTAIDALARQAGINYLMDPKIGYGQPDAQGNAKPEPSLTIRWENITHEQALLALLDTYGLQLVTDQKTKISKITTKDPTAPPPLLTHVYQLAYASVQIMQSAITTTLTDKRSKVVSDVRTSQLVVLATEKEQSDVDDLIKRLDKPTRQVLIETRFIEVSSNPSTTKGIDWSGTFQAQNVKVGNTSTFIVQPTAASTTVDAAGVVHTTPAQPGLVNGVINTPAVIGSSTGGFLGPWFLNADGVKAVMSFFNTSSDAQVVSTPRIVTLDNELATISVTRAFPIFQTTAGTQGSPGGSSINYSNVGIVLQVTPHISANDYVWMKVQPSISSYFDTVTKTINGFVNQADEFDSRNIDTQVMIPNANTLVMGGMVKDSPNAKYTKVPILGDIPILGFAFRSEAKSIDKQNLLIFITPTIIKESDYQPTVTEFLNSRPIKEKQPIDPNSLWESGKKYDWSNPKNTDTTQAVINQKTTD